MLLINFKKSTTFFQEKKKTSLLIRHIKHCTPNKFFLNLLNSDFKVFTLFLIAEDRLIYLTAEVAKNFYLQPILVFCLE